MLLDLVVQLDHLELQVNLDQQAQQVLEENQAAQDREENLAFKEKQDLRDLWDYQDLQAREDKLDLGESQAQPARMDNQALKEREVNQAVLALLVREEPRVRGVKLDRLVARDQGEQPAHREVLDPEESQVCLVLMDNLDNEESKDYKEDLVSRAVLDQQAQ